MNLPFVRIAAASPNTQVGDWGYNALEIKKMITQAENQSVNIITFPELSITGYSCADLFFQASLLEGAKNALLDIARHTKGLSIFVAVGLPVRAGSKIFNCAAALYDGKVLGLIPKTYLPNNNEFYERRWFNIPDKDYSIDFFGEKLSICRELIFRSSNGARIAIEICEDLWSPIPPSSYMALEGANVILNLSASNDLTGKADYRRDLINSQSARLYVTYCYASAGPGESTTDVVYGGHCIISENGKALSEKVPFDISKQMIIADTDIEHIDQERLSNKNFSLFENSNRKETKIIDFYQPPLNGETNRKIDPMPFVPSDMVTRDLRCGEIFEIQVAALKKRIRASGAKTAVIGISGGLDSTLALLAVVRTFDAAEISRENIIAITMPGFGTTDRTYTNAVTLIKSLRVTFMEIPIADACMQHFKDIGHDPSLHDVTFENVQARERTQILMDISNKHSGIVIGTGDLSEIALGWSTYNGDHMSMYAINCGVPKTLIRSMVSYVASSGQVGDEAAIVLGDIIDTPVSPELLPPDAEGKIHQKTEDIVGPYELHDFFLYNMIRHNFTPTKILCHARLAFKDKYDTNTIIKWMEVFYRRFFTQQFKRSCIPDGPKVGSVALSPRGDWRMPSDASSSMWLREIDSLKSNSQQG